MIQQKMARMRARTSKSQKMKRYSEENLRFKRSRPSSSFEKKKILRELDFLIRGPLRKIQTKIFKRG